jgi:hypothetical protein
MASLPAPRRTGSRLRLPPAIPVAPPRRRTASPPHLLRAIREVSPMGRPRLRTDKRRVPALAVPSRHPAASLPRTGSPPPARPAARSLRPPMRLPRPRVSPRSAPVACPSAPRAPSTRPAAYPRARRRAPRLPPLRAAAGTARATPAAPRRARAVRSPCVRRWPRHPRCRTTSARTTPRRPRSSLGGRAGARQPPAPRRPVANCRVAAWRRRPPLPPRRCPIRPPVVVSRKGRPPRPRPARASPKQPCPQWVSSPPRRPPPLPASAARCRAGRPARRRPRRPT